MLRPGLLGRVEIEAGAQAEIPGAVGVVRHVRTARAGIRRYDDQPKLGSQALCTGLLHEVFIGAGQPRQPVQHRQPSTLLGLRRQVHGEYHVAVQAAGTMTVTLVPATETLVAGNDF
ncbi:hypothetical protein D3C77_557980 [compost metagenome]